ncbi:MAG: 50S ribosome-binding GTPase, partial [Mycoplasmoidaceae bacterium]|nr:50S ribosome-binding GTPase [Mycoplasmoidaceae bacterium]
IQSEAINNLINSSNDIALNAALNGLDNNSNLQLQKIRDDIFKILGQTEVDIDYPEYESTPDVTKKEIANIFNNTIKVIKQIITDSSQVITIKDGINIAIIGKPNVGKSSLLNALLKEDKAIVSNIPGTTRDAIESSCVINGIKFNFVDTAGIRDTKNKIEKIGVDKALKVSQEANLILFVIDNSKKITNKDKKIINSLKGKNYQIILNKSDKKQLNDIKGLKISAKNNEIKPLIKYLSNYINIEKINLPNKLILQNQLSIDLLKNVLDNIVEAQKIYKQDSMLEMVCPLLSNSIELIEKIVGNPNDLSFIDELFSKFCVGK